MYKLSVSFLLFAVFALFSTISSAQTSEDSHIIHFQTNKLVSGLGDDADAFNDVLKRQSEVANKDPRLLSFRIVRHYWGADSHDLVIISEFKNTDDLFAFYNDYDSMMEKAFSKEQLDKDNALYNKYVGQHSDEIYQEVPGTRK